MAATTRVPARTSPAGLGVAEPLDYAGVQRAVAGWRRYAGLGYFHLLLDRLAAPGDLE
jgi:hypothetical protein